MGTDPNVLCPTCGTAARVDAPFYAGRHADCWMPVAPADAPVSLATLRAAFVQMPLDVLKDFPLDAIGKQWSVGPFLALLHERMHASPKVDEVCCPDECGCVLPSSGFALARHQDAASARKEPLPPGRPLTEGECARIHQEVRYWTDEQARFRQEQAERDADAAYEKAKATQGDA